MDPDMRQTGLAKATESQGWRCSTDLESLFHPCLRPTRHLITRVTVGLLVAASSLLSCPSSSLSLLLDPSPTLSSNWSF
ncbi:unnamed protein product [Protopolystoma xenopodis]|uniref:Uncharacterized protein n=1 Tax=Protopolystoma xenopodis TaxID=117903 RepID=A0A448WWJ4_9PLAT|nr:unnamed protein product [Protopolystoma xenopodis]